MSTIEAAKVQKIPHSVLFVWVAEKGCSWYENILLWVVWLLVQSLGEASRTQCN
jgi:hypothetical protein